MTPKEKADSLMTKFRTVVRKTDVVSEDEIYLSKQCAIIAVDEILNITLFYFEDEKYWQQVKQEIEKL